MSEKSIPEYTKTGEHGDGPELPFCVLVELLGEDEFYTTGEAARSRFEPSGRGVRGPFEKIRDNLGHMLRKRRAQPDALVRNGCLIEVIPDEDGVLRGTRAFKGSTLKDLMKPRGKARGKLGVIFLRWLHECSPTPNGRSADGLLPVLNKLHVGDLSNLIRVLDGEREPENEEVANLALWLNQLSRDGVRSLLNAFGHQPFEPALLPSEPRNEAEPQPEIAMEPEITLLPQSHLEAEPTELPKPVSVPGVSRFRKVLLVAMVAVTFTLVGFKVADFFTEREIMDTIQREGSARASTLEIDRENPTSLLAHAYTLYHNGDMEEARKLLFTILSRSDLKMIHEATAYYYLASVRQSAGDTNAAVIYFDLAADMFEADGSHINVFKALTGKARVHALTNQSNLARAALGKAYRYYDLCTDENKEQWLEHWHAVSARVEIGRGRFQDALEHCKQRVALIPKDHISTRASATSCLGLAYALAGDLERAAWHTDEAELLITLVDNEMERMYNMVNRVLIRRCKGQAYEEMQAEIQHYASQANLWSLQQELDLVLQVPVPCEHSSN